MQLLAGLQIEFVDHPGDCGRRRRTQRLGHRPQRVFAMRGLNEDQAAWIEAERVEAVSAKPAMLAPPIGRQDEDNSFPRSSRAALARARVQACWGRGESVGKERHDEAESGRESRLPFGHHLMQGAAGQAARRQVRIHGGKAEGQGLVQTFSAQTLVSRKQPPQFMHCNRAVSRFGKSVGEGTGKTSSCGHLASLANPVLRPFWPWKRSQCSLYIPGGILEQKENIAKRAFARPAASMGTLHKLANRRAFSCAHCGHHACPTANTVFQDTRTPLQVWFYAIYLFATTRHSANGNLGEFTFRSNRRQMTNAMFDLLISAVLVARLNCVVPLLAGGRPVPRASSCRINSAKRSVLR